MVEIASAQQAAKAWLIQLQRSREAMFRMLSKTLTAICTAMRIRDT
jgi:hypothetical protein